MRRSKWPRRILSISIVAIAIAACGGGKGLSPAAARLSEGSELELADCEQLERVNGSAEGDNAEERSKNAAREKAAALGATHIRWLVPCCTYVEAATYRCDTPIE